MKTKNFDAQVKAAGPADGLDDGQFEAIVSVFGNEDSYGDVVMPGAFKADLARWEAKGDPLPVIWSHDWTDPFSHLGTVLAAEERPEGLWVRAQIEDMDTNPKAAQVYRLLKGRRVTQFSFAYDVEDAGYGKRDDRDVYELRQLKVHEVGPCLLGVNQETELLTIKARALVEGVKAGRDLDLSAVREARDTLTVLLDTAKSGGDPYEDDDDITQPEHPEAESTPPEDRDNNTETSPPTRDGDETDEPSQADEVSGDEEPPGVKSPTGPASAPRRARAVALITNLS